jgi:uncharacterized protein YggE
MKKVFSLVALVVISALVMASPAAAAKTHAASGAGDKGALTVSSAGGVTTLTGCGYKNGYAVSITVTDSTGAQVTEVASDAGQNCVSASFTLASGDYAAHASQDVDGGLVRLNYPTLDFTVA